MACIARVGIEQQRQPIRLQNTFLQQVQNSSVLMDYYPLRPAVELDTVPRYHRPPCESVGHLSEKAIIFYAQVSASRHAGVPGSHPGRQSLVILVQCGFNAAVNLSVKRRFHDMHPRCVADGRYSTDFDHAVK